MSLRDLANYWAFRGLVANPYEVTTFRKVRDPGRELIVRMRGNPAIYLRGATSDFHMFHRIFIEDEYHLNPLLESLSCVIDIGGNVGMFCVRVAPYADKVIVYEPVPTNFQRLEKNTGGFSNVSLVEAAVLDHIGELQIFEPISQKQSGTYSSFKTEDSHHLSDHSVTARVVTLDWLFEEHGVDHCDLLKIDAEGAEYDVIHGASDETLNRIDRIYGEYHDVRAEDPRTRIESFQNHLRDKGFVVDSEPHPKKVNHGMVFAYKPSLKA